MDGMKVDNIANKLGIKYRTVVNTKSTVLEKLKREISELGRCIVINLITYRIFLMYNTKIHWRVI